MFQSVQPILRAVAVTALLGSAALAIPAQAATGSAATGESAAQARPGTAPHARRSPVDRVEARIKELHAKLKITEAQEPAWSNFTQVMRDNAKNMDALLKRRAAGLKSMSAVDDLRSYADLSEAHAESVKNLVPAFRTLYGTMSDEQKKNADAVFRHSMRTASRHK